MVLRCKINQNPQCITKIFYRKDRQKTPPFRAGFPEFPGLSGPLVKTSLCAARANEEQSNAVQARQKENYS